MTHLPRARAAAAGRVPHRSADAAATRTRDDARRRAAAADRAVRVRLAGPGVASCCVGLFDGLPSTVAVDARERARLALIPRATFDELVAARTRAGRSFLEALQRDLVEALRLAQRQQSRLVFG
jgi:hypothetical protein